MGYYGLGPGMRVADQLTPFEKALQSVPVECYEITLEILEKLIKNIAQNPAEPKFRKINLKNEKIFNSITSVNGAVQALIEAGFVSDNSDATAPALVLPAGVKLTFPDHVVKVQNAKDVLKKLEEKDRVARGLSRVAPIRQAGEKPVDKRDAGAVASNGEAMLRRLCAVN